MIETTKRQNGSQPGTLVDRFTTDRWHTVPLEILLSPGQVRAEIQDELGPMVTRFSEAIGLPAPPAVRIAADRRLANDEYVMKTGGVTRFGSWFKGQALAWWRERPVAAAGGRTGIAAGAVSPSDALTPVEELGRAIEEVLWDDPGLVADNESLTALQDGALLATPLAVFKALLSSRVSLRDPHLREVLSRAQTKQDLADQLGSVMSALRPSTVTIRLGGRLHDRLVAPEVVGPFDDQFSDLRESIFKDLGVGYGNFDLQRDTTLDDVTFQIVINSIPRATGAINPDWVYVKTPPGTSGVPALEPYVDPVTAELLGSGPARGFLAGAHPTDTYLDARGLLARHVEACLREAAWEFADAAWTQQQMERLLQGFPHLVGLARALESSERVTTICGRLVRESLSMRDLYRILELVVQGKGEPTTAASPMLMTEFIRRGLADYVSSRFSELRSVPGSTTIKPVGRRIWAILPPPLERSRLLQALRTSGEGSAYPLASEGRFLLWLSRQLAKWRIPAYPVLLVDGDLRPHLARLLAAQFPRLSVLSFDELEPDLWISAPLNNRTGRVLTLRSPASPLASAARAVFQKLGRRIG